jgi:hypothetical protein
MFLKEKRDGKIKGRTVAGGNKQRDYISKEDASSPTVATESVLLSCIIDAEEERDVAVIDIPNAFVQTHVEEEKDMAIIKLRGVLVDILVEMARRRGKGHDNYQSSWNPSGYPGGDGTRHIQVVHYNRQERGETVTGTVPERPIWYDGCKPTVLSQVHQELDGNWIRAQSTI